MKKIILFTFFAITSASSFSQQNNPEISYTKQDYLKKSKNQKTGAILFLVGGSLITMAGGGMALGNVSGLFDPTQPDSEPVNEDVVDALVYSGLVIAAVSIPFFIASSKNKKKAMSMSFKNQMIPQMQHGSLVARNIPSLQLKIRL